MEEEALSALCTPALVVDLDKVKRNAERMIDRCQNLGVQLRPHMKTHKTLYDTHIHTNLNYCSFIYIAANHNQSYLDRTL